MDRLTDLWRIRSTAASHLCRNIWNRGLACLRSAREVLLAPDDTRMLQATWHGTDAELYRLRASLEHNWPSTVVTIVDVGIVVRTIVLDQHLADSLLGAYRSRDWFVQHEFTAEVVNLRA